MFHSEHNRLVDHIEDVLNGLRPELEAQDSAQRGGIAAVRSAFRGETHSYASDKATDQLPALRAGRRPGCDARRRHGGRLDSTSSASSRPPGSRPRCSTSTSSSRSSPARSQPDIDAVVFNENSYNATVDPAITAEFAHVVYRFGHSMLTEDIGRERRRRIG